MDIFVLQPSRQVADEKLWETKKAEVTIGTEHVNEELDVSWVNSQQKTALAYFFKIKRYIERIMSWGEGLQIAAVSMDWQTNIDHPNFQFSKDFKTGYIVKKHKKKTHLK